MSGLSWMFVLAAIVSLDMRIVTPVLPTIAEALGATPGEVGYGITFYSLAYGSCQVVFGPLSDRYGRIRVVRVTTLLFACATALSGAAGGVGGFVTARFFTGMFAAATIPTTFAYIGDTIAYEHRPRMIARVSVILSAAQALSAALAGLVTHVVSWRVMFVSYSVLCIVPVAALFGTGERRPVRAPEARVSWAAILGLARARRLYLLAFAEGVFIVAGSSYLGVLAHERYAFNDLQSGLVLACYGGGTIAGGMALGRLTTAMGQPTVASWGAIAYVVAYLLIAMPGPPAVLVAALLVLGAGWAWFHTMLQTLGTELVPQARGKAFSLFPLSFNLGGAVGAALAGRLVDAGLVSAVMAACAIGLGVVGWVAVRRTPRRAAGPGRKRR
jgi:predicted MFS family arabinose efflux permease